MRYYRHNIIIIIQYSMNLYYNRSLTATVRLGYLNNFLRSVRVYKSKPRYSGELLLLNCDRNSGPSSPALPLRLSVWHCYASCRKHSTNQPGLSSPPYSVRPPPTRSDFLLYIIIITVGYIAILWHIDVVLLYPCKLLFVECICAYNSAVIL